MATPQPNITIHAEILREAIAQNQKRKLGKLTCPQCKTKMALVHMTQLNFILFTLCTQCPYFVRHGETPVKKPLLAGGNGDE